MSTCYWMCEGIGIRTNELRPYLSKEKCKSFLENEINGLSIDENECFDIDDFCFGEPFENLGDMLCHCDDTNTMTYGDNGDGEYYFFYAPSYPWLRTENEPTSIEEVKERIKDAVEKLCDLTRDEIGALIDDDIYVWMRIIKRLNKERCNKYE